MAAGQQCLSCRVYPQDILILDCNHHYCLACSASLASLPYYFICPICAKRTILLPQTSQQLYSYAPSKVLNSKKSELIPPIKLQKRKVRINCKQHKDEEASYFCFDCLTECVCSECVVHGIHRNHQVHQVKKARPVIQSKLLNLKDSFSDAGLRWQEVRNSLQSQALIVKQVERQTLLRLQQTFQKHQLYLVQKHNQFRAKAKQLFSDQQNILKQDLDRVGEQICRMSENGVQTDEAIRMSDSQMLNWFVKNEQGLQRDLRRQSRLSEPVGQWQTQSKSLLEQAENLLLVV